MRRTVLLLLAIISTLVVPATAASAAPTYEIHYVDTVDGATIRLEIYRDTKFDEEGQPVILTYSPYNNLNDPTGGTLAEDSLGQRYVRKGYARAYADVLGTRGSTGCYDYGGPFEQQSGVDVVNYLTSLEWSNGNVGMIGVSYEGTTANMVAAAGDRAPGLKAIVPVAAISRWYGYAFSNGVRYFLNSFAPDNEGFDTPLAFDFGFGRTVPPPDDPGRFSDAVVARTGECDAIAHTEQAYSRNPDYTDFWYERDYVHDTSNYRAAALIVHGWQDYNVKQEEAINLYESLQTDDPATPEVEGPPFKLMWLTQLTHADGAGEGYQELLDQFFEQTLMGVDHGLEELNGQVRTEGRTFDGPDEVRFEESWPVPGTQDVTLHLGRWFDYDYGQPGSGVVGSNGETGVLSTEPQDTGVWTWTDLGTTSELIVEEDPLNEDGHGYYSLFYSTPELAQDVRVAGRALLDAWVTNQVGQGTHLTPVLLDVATDGTMRVAERGFMNLDYRNGLEEAQPATGWVNPTVDMLPQDYTFEAGHRIGLLVMSSNTIWAVPGNPGGVWNIANGPVDGNEEIDGSQLILPVVNPPADPLELFTEPAPAAPAARSGAADGRADTGATASISVSVDATGLVDHSDAKTSIPTSLLPTFSRRGFRIV